MANPISVACPVGTWTKVATAVTSGVIFEQDSSPAKYLQTYKLTGEAAPTDDDEAAPIFMAGSSAEIGHTEPIDVYIKAISAAGAVRVDL